MSKYLKAWNKALLFRYAHERNSLSLYDPYPLANLKHFLRHFDFGGVAQNTSRAGTLISSNVIVQANHFSSDVGDPVVFYSNPSGFEVRSIVVRSIQIQRDLRVSLIEPSVTRSYRIFRDVPDLIGQHIICLDGQRKAYLRHVERGGLQNHIQHSRPGFWTRIRFNPVHPHLSEEPELGDSSHPLFYPLWSGELILLGVHNFAGMFELLTESEVVDAVESLGGVQPRFVTQAEIAATPPRRGTSRWGRYV